MQWDKSNRISRPPSDIRWDINRLSLRCAIALLFGVIGFGLLITVAKPVLSTFLFGDVSVYLVVILALALGIWALTWFYMARLGAQGADQ
jgi:uncharacterized membrane protein (DUF485 family)